MAKPIAVLAFSGGLDTSFCVPWLREAGYDVVTVTVDTGGFDAEELTKITARAHELGVKEHYTIDGRMALYEKLVSVIISGNMLRGGVYPLCAGPERLIQATEVVGLARKIGATAIAHGSTGAGNDQVRFDLAVRALMPEALIITPIRELGAQRVQEVAYLEDHGYSVAAKTGRYSVNQGLLGTTIGGGETLDSWGYPPEEAFIETTAPADAPDTAVKLVIGYEKGLPVSIDGQLLTPLALMGKLAEIGGQHGVGRNIHLGNTILGLKGRVAFEAPAALIAITAHKELEKLVLTKHQSFWKDHLADVYSNFLHEGLFFDPVMRDIEAMISSSQTTVTGEVRVSLFKGHITVEGVRSPYSLLDRNIGSYGETNRAWTGSEAAAFSKLYGIQSVLGAARRAQAEADAPLPPAPKSSNGNGNGNGSAPKNGTQNGVEHSHQNGKVDGLVGAAH